MIRIPEKENTQPASQAAQNGKRNRPTADAMQINGTLKIEALSSSCSLLQQQQDGGGTTTSPGNLTQSTVSKKKQTIQKAFSFIFPDLLPLLLLVYCRMVSFNLANCYGLKRLVGRHFLGTLCRCC